MRGEFSGGNKFISVFNLYYFHFNDKGLPCGEMMCCYEIMTEQRALCGRRTHVERGGQDEPKHRVPVTKLYLCTVICSW